MAWRKTPDDGAATPPPKSTARAKRHARQKARREKTLRQRPPGVKERFVAGCMALGIASAVVFLALVAYQCSFGGER